MAIRALQPNNPDALNNLGLALLQGGQAAEAVRMFRKALGEHPEFGEAANNLLLALTLSLDDVVITNFVAGPGATTLPVYVFGLVRRGVTPLINAVSTVMLVASMVLVAVSFGLQRGSRGRVSASTTDDR